MPECVLKLYDIHTVAQLKVYSGSKSSAFRIKSGSRLVVSIYIKSIDVGANLEVKVKNRFSGAIPYSILETINANAVGETKRVYTDFHPYFDFECNVTGGNVEYAIGVTVLESSDSFSKVGEDVLDSLYSKTPKLFVVNSGTAGDKKSHTFQDGLKKFSVTTVYNKCSVIFYNWDETDYDNDIFHTIDEGSELERSAINLAGKTIYFKCDIDNVDVEIEEWI